MAAKSKPRLTTVATALPRAETKAREQVLAAAVAMSRMGLSPGRSGNVSQRHRDGMLITPSGLAYDALEPKDIVFVGNSGRFDPAGLKPSSEWLFHLAAYAARPDRHGVVHTHSLHATVLACAHRSIPAFHYMVAVAGGNDIPLVPYATFGSEELARTVAAGLSLRDACLMANHGLIALGHDTASALELAREVETLAEQYVKVLALGAPHILPDDEMARVLQKFKTYGQRAQS